MEHSVGRLIQVQVEVRQCNDCLRIVGQVGWQSIAHIPLNNQLSLDMPKRFGALVSVENFSKVARIVVRQRKVPGLRSRCERILGDEVREAGECVEANDPSVRIIWLVARKALRAAICRPDGPRTP